MKNSPTFRFENAGESYFKTSGKCFSGMSEFHRKIPEVFRLQTTDYISCSSSLPERIGRQILYFTASIRVTNTVTPPTIWHTKDSIPKRWHIQ